MKYAIWGLVAMKFRTADTGSRWTDDINAAQAFDSMEDAVAYVQADRDIGKVTIVGVREVAIPRFEKVEL